jgi:hypothetical protein
LFAGVAGARVMARVTNNVILGRRPGCMQICRIQVGIIMIQVGIIMIQVP